MVFDEVYEQFGNHPCLEGWYITEEFHDGSYPVGWLLILRPNRISPFLSLRLYGEVCRPIFAGNGLDGSSLRRPILIIYTFRILADAVWWMWM